MNLINSTSTFSFYVLISRILGYLRDVLIAIYLGSGPIADAFLLHLEYPIHLEGYFQKEHLMLHLSPVILLKWLKEKKKHINLQIMFSIYF